MTKKDKLDKLIFIVYVAGFNHGLNNDGTGLLDAVNRLKAGGSPQKDDASYPTIPKLINEINEDSSATAD